MYSALKTYLPSIQICIISPVEDLRSGESIKKLESKMRANIYSRHCRYAATATEKLGSQCLFKNKNGILC